MTNEPRELIASVPQTKTFKTKNDSPAFWSGFAKQTIAFQHALGELVDNGLSARQLKTIGRDYVSATIEITLEQLGDNSVKVQVADAGTGIPWEYLTGEENIFNLGFQPPNKGALNEHGFGLKNALALLTSGFANDFTLLTRTRQEGKLFRVDGPIKAEMTAVEVDVSEWGADLDILKGADTGTKITCFVKDEYFSTIYQRGQKFEGHVNRLMEHLGVMYRYFIDSGNEIYMRYKSKEAETWSETSKVPAIPVPFLEAPGVTKKQDVIEVEFAGKKHRAIYTHGQLDQSVKDKNTGRQDPYPLRIHFQGSNARCGVTIVVRNRVLKTGVFKEIWPTKAGDVSFNNFLGELRLESELSTTNNKTDLDPQGEVWNLIIDELKANFEPEKDTKRQSEESLRKTIIRQISAVNNLSDSNEPKHKNVWDGGAEIDIYYHHNSQLFAIETKVDSAKVIDVYQLLMYWDGLVEEGKTPHLGILVAKDAPANVSQAIEHINSLIDKQGNNYNLIFRSSSNYISG